MKRCRSIAAGGAVGKTYARWPGADRETGRLSGHSIVCEGVSKIGGIDKDI